MPYRVNTIQGEYYTGGTDMEARESLEKLRSLALDDRNIRDRLLATKKEPNPISAFCRLSTELGCELYEMDLIDLGEEAYAAMRRSTNGGGENSPLLAGEDDYYELFLDELVKMG
jgi:hypothetical protein